VLAQFVSVQKTLELEGARSGVHTATIDHLTVHYKKLKTERVAVTFV
jgi:hypothetical protein